MAERMAQLPDIRHNVGTILKKREDKLNERNVGKRGVSSSGKPQKPFSGPGIVAAKSYFSEDVRMNSGHEADVESSFADFSQNAGGA